MFTLVSYLGAVAEQDGVPTALLTIVAVWRVVPCGVAAGAAAALLGLAGGWG